jgi:hypothetical protein
MGPTIIILDKRPLVDCTEKVDLSIVVGLDGYRELVPNFATFYTLARNSSVMVRTRPAWAPY